MSDLCQEILDKNKVWRRSELENPCWLEPSLLRFGSSIEKPRVFKTLQKIHRWLLVFTFVKPIKRTYIRKRCGLSKLSLAIIIDVRWMAGELVSQVYVDTAVTSHKWTGVINIYISRLEPLQEWVMMHSTDLPPC